MVFSGLAGIAACVQGVRRAFIAAQVEAALAQACDDGPALTFIENGMTEPSRYGRHVEASAAQEADHIFTRILMDYLEILAKFKANHPDDDEIEYVGAEYIPPRNTLAQTAFDSLLEAHNTFLHGKVIPRGVEAGRYAHGAVKAAAPQMKDSSEQARELNESSIRQAGINAPNISSSATARSETTNEARFLLKSPLEFADHNSHDLFSPQEQLQFSALLRKLRRLAGV